MRSHCKYHDFNGAVCVKGNFSPCLDSTNHNLHPDFAYQTNHNPASWWEATHPEEVLLALVLEKEAASSYLPLLKQLSILTLQEVPP